MREFVLTYIVKPYRGRWWKGFLLLALWTVAFVALPSISGWFLAISSVVFATANTTFSYLVPSAIIRLLSLLRTATRYFERLENHKTTLSVQQSLQLKIFGSVARLPYFKKQVNNNSSLLENSTHGVDQILNHILLWLLPFFSSTSDNRCLFYLPRNFFKGNCNRVSYLFGNSIVSGSSIHIS
jgi:ATP-binding cassette subfamily C protein CydC